jgi:hypothetical protein
VQLRQTRTQKKIVVDESLSLSKRLLREEPDVAELDAPPKRINALPGLVCDGNQIGADVVDFDRTGLGYQERQISSW